MSTEQLKPLSDEREAGKIDANVLERMAKERPDEYFLKGSGILKLTSAIRYLEQQNRALLSQSAQPQVSDETDLNAPWLTIAHAICTDAGIPQGHITDRLTKLREKSAQPVPSVPEGWQNAIEKIRKNLGAGGNGWGAQAEISVGNVILDIVTDALSELDAAAPQPKEGEA
jgi:hypothetical protein